STPASPTRCSSSRRRPAPPSYRWMWAVENPQSGAMASAFSKKRLEKLTGSQYALLRDLTGEATVDAASLERVVAGIVSDRFEMARGFIKAARVLRNSADPIIQRSAVSRAYYGAYQAARATFFSITRQDEGDHEKLGREIDSIKDIPGSPGATLKELRRL